MMRLQSNAVDASQLRLLQPINHAPQRATVMPGRQPCMLWGVVGPSFTVSKEKGGEGALPSSVSHSNFVLQTLQYPISL